ncbi:DNA polymerase III subunit alpha [Fulvivirgaceae bacterium BMA10]|uniref:DNA-directed DNA polymerase n=1 Tax=Splendidivirga corallicola TaxID=3051826 RepID=A0ABT8KQQ9_9BACT|nr:DNA polymerase III subunit alpha [Fulvivirgaceae bacterium BMA10]
MHLNCHTYLSFKYGTLSPAELFKLAKRHGIKKLIITDINNTAAYIDMLRICNEERSNYDLNIALGIEFRRDDQLLYIGIAQNNEGFRKLNGYLSHHNMKDLPLLSKAPELEHTFFIYPFQTIDPENLRENEFVGIKIHEVNRIISSPYQHYQHKLVVLHPVTFKDKITFNTHRLLRAIDQNTILSKLDPKYQAHPNEVMMPENVLAQYYERYPIIIRNTKKLLTQCTIAFDFKTDKNKSTFYESKIKDREKLRSMASEGFKERYRGSDIMKEAEERFNRELEIISKRNFEAYFLICDDIVKFAKHKNFEHVGRGSGANSIIAYCLGLTDVDPIELDLYFERFLNPERSSPPDFDIDFSWKDRNTVIDYIFEKFGYEHTALLGTHVTFQSKSVIRELGKVFGLPKSEIDNIVAYPQYHRNKDHITKLIFRYAEHFKKIPKHLSIHAGGILITEEPIYTYTAVDLPPKDFPVGHFEMHAAEDMGIYKFDILSQRGLGHIKDSVEIISKNQNIQEDVKRFTDFKKDPKIKALLSTGKTMGCFYVESPAMRMLLGKLKCADYITLVAASSIIRPGVARSGMMRAYIERHHSNGNYESIHPKMDELMQETYGVMVYQEDVIKVAHHFAGLTLAEADILRRGMSGKFRSRKEFLRVRDRFFDNCKEKGYKDEVTARVWYEIESFSGYSFSKGHSASYAVESYQSLYLKAHYPLEFMVGVINNFGGFYKTEFYFHEARMDGASVEAPCVNHGEYLTSIKGITIYVGFIHLKSLETNLGKMIPIEREQNGPFKSLDNFIKRIPVGLEQLRLLIRIGAFRFIGKSKKELLWHAHFYFGERKVARHSRDLFEEEVKVYELPELEKNPYEDAFDEMELLGFPLCDPFFLLKKSYRDRVKASDLMQRLQQNIEIVGYLITTKNTHTKDGKPMHFGTFYDYEGQVFDTTHFPNVAKRFPFRGKGFYLLKGKVVEDFGYPMIEISYMQRIPMVDKYNDVEEELAVV